MKIIKFNLFGQRRIIFCFVPRWWKHSAKEWLMFHRSSNKDITIQCFWFDFLIRKVEK